MECFASGLLIMQTDIFCVHPSFWKTFFVRRTHFPGRRRRFKGFSNCIVSARYRYVAAVALYRVVRAGSTMQYLNILNRCQTNSFSFGEVLRKLKLIFKISLCKNVGLVLILKSQPHPLTTSHHTSFLGSKRSLKI